MLRTAQAVRYAKHNINSMFSDEKLYHDVMFSIGSGAGEKHDIDITSQFSLLPDAHIDETAVDALADLGDASSAFTPKPHAEKNSSSSSSLAEEQFFDDSMQVPDPPIESMPAGPPPGSPPAPGIPQ